MIYKIIAPLIVTDIKPISMFDEWSIKLIGSLYHTQQLPNVYIPYKFSTHPTNVQRQGD